MVITKKDNQGKKKFNWKRFIISVVELAIAFIGGTQVS